MVPAISDTGKKLLEDNLQSLNINIKIEKDIDVEVGIKEKVEHFNGGKNIKQEIQDPEVQISDVEKKSGLFYIYFLLSVSQHTLHTD